MRPRVVATVQAAAQAPIFQPSMQGNGVTPEMIEEGAEYIERFAGHASELARGISRIPAPATILDRVASIIAKLDNAADKYSEVAIAFRHGASRQDMLELERQGDADLDGGLRALGLLGATSCSDLV
jgi:hypothetical protein